MIKYIYYRICKDWERKQKLNKTLWSNPPYAWLYSFMSFLFMPFAFLGGTLMDSDNKWTGSVASGFILLWAIYFFSHQFEKRMKNYTPSEQYKRFDKIPLFCFTGPLFLLMILWCFGGILLMSFYVIEPFNLNGWLYNHLFP